MMEWSTACPDWESRIINRESLVPFPPLFPEYAELALNIFKGLVMGDVRGRPTFGEASAEWVFDFVRAIFGAYNYELKKQLINEFLLLISKKNAKSTIAAGIMITALILNDRDSAELLILAPTKEVADNAYKPASNIVKYTPGLSSTLKSSDYHKKIINLKTSSILKVVAADPDTVAGSKASYIFIDELWLFGKDRKAKDMIDEATGGLASFPEGFVIFASTQSDEPPSGIFADKIKYYRNIRDGIITDNKSLGILYEFPENMLSDNSYKNSKYYYITNPNIGRSTSVEHINGKILKSSDEINKRSVFAKYLNVEISNNLRSNRWSGAEYWQRQTDNTLTYETLLDRSEVVVIGVDGGGLDDLFGLSLVGRDKETKEWLSWSHAWAHESVLERHKQIASQLNDYASDGDLTIVNDSLDDISDIIAIVDEVKQRGLLACVAVDPAGLGELLQSLAEIDVTEESKLVIGVPQGFALMNAIKTSERKLANKTIWHAPSRMMMWCVGNLKIEPTATAIRATKQNAGIDKIDPVMAFFDAVTVMSRNPEAKREPSYQMMFLG